MDEHELPKFSAKEMVVMRLLIEHGELFGREMVKRSDGELGKGTVYVTLDRLEQRGMVTSRQEEPQPGAIGTPRRMYRASALGVRGVEAIEMARAHFAGGGVP